MVLLKESGLIYVYVSFSVVRLGLILTIKKCQGKYLCIGQLRIELRQMVKLQQIFEIINFSLKTQNAMKKGFITTLTHTNRDTSKMQLPHTATTTPQLPHTTTSHNAIALHWNFHTLQLLCTVTPVRLYTATPTHCDSPAGQHLHVATPAHQSPATSAH